MSRASSLEPAGPSRNTKVGQSGWGHGGGQGGRRKRPGPRQWLPQASLIPQLGSGRTLTAPESHTVL